LTNQVSHTFRKEEKLCSKKLMGELFLSGNNLLCYPLRIVWKTYEVLPSDSPSQVGFSVPKRLFRHASDRNRLKRLLRESYRLQKHILYDALSHSGTRMALMFVYIATEQLPYSKLEPAVSKAIQKIINQL
jgi:ribonuclease P protein component